MDIKGDKRLTRNCNIDKGTCIMGSNEWMIMIGQVGFLGVLGRALWGCIGSCSRPNRQ